MAAAWDAVLEFWFGGLELQARFRADAGVDAAVRERFGALHAALSAGVGEEWRAAPRPLLAAVVVLDQFSRNLFRGRAEAFAGDRAALALAKDAVTQGWDGALTAEQRMFLYMPFEHSERLADVERAVELIGALGDAEWTAFAERHAAVIRRFGRYPARNAALGRASTAEEEAFLEANALGF